jgi:hypothetical protein
MTIKPVLTKEIIEGLTEEGNIPVYPGTCECEGGYNAIITDGIDSVIQFSKPVFKKKSQAMAYAKRKFGMVMAQMAREAAALGYEIVVVDGNNGNGAIQ